MDIASRFNKNTLKKIQNNLPKSYKNINNYREFGVYSYLCSNKSKDSGDAIIKTLHKYNQQIQIVYRWVNSRPAILTENVPEHTNQCLCEAVFTQHHWIYHIETKAIHLIGSCCIKKFMTFRGKVCIGCNSNHNNNASNYCNNCRIKCYDCNKYHIDNTKCNQGIIRFNKYKIGCKECGKIHTVGSSNLCVDCFLPCCAYCNKYHSDEKMCSKNVIRFGKYKGYRICDVPESYINWLRNLTDKSYHIEKLLELV